MDPVRPVKPHGALFYVGAAGLLSLMAIEAIAVVGRLLRTPLLGALEMAQAAIVPAACASMVIATIASAHAAVHLVTERLPGPQREWMARASALLSGIFFSALSVGAWWLMQEFWNSFEQTDVLEIPFRPLRLLVTVCTGALAIIFFARALRGRPL